MRDFLNQQKMLMVDVESRLQWVTRDIQKLEEDSVLYTKALIILQEAAKLSQEHLATHLSLIVTQAIQAVIEKPYEFVCEFVERRGTTEADLYLKKDGEKFDILGGTGGGLADVCSFSLKVAYLMLSNVNKVLVIDEVSRHINGKRQRENFARVLSRLSQEFDIQMIINSTIPEIHEIADNLIELRQGVNGTILV